VASFCKGGHDRVLRSSVNFVTMRATVSFSMTLLNHVASPTYCFYTVFYVPKGKADLLQACSGPEGSRKLRFTQQDGGKFVSFTHRPHLPPENTPGTHFCWRLCRPQGHSAIGSIYVNEKFHDTIWDRTSDILICSEVL
jgi:hypothetical protein